MVWQTRIKNRNAARRFLRRTSREGLVLAREIRIPSERRLWELKRLCAIYPEAREVFERPTSETETSGI